MFAAKKGFFDKHCGLNFFLRKCPIAVELNLKHRKLTKVVEQTHNMSTWSDRSKKLPSMSCLLGIQKSNEHCSKVVSGCWQKNTRKTRVTDTREYDQNVGWGTHRQKRNVKGRTLHDILHRQQVLQTHTYAR